MTIRTIAIIICLSLALPGLAGCGARLGAEADGMSLMDRFQSGQDLFAKAAGPEALAARGDEARAADRPDLALRLYDAALETEPDLVRAQLGKGLALLDSGRARVALAVLEPLLGEHPDNAAAHEAAGRAWLAENRLDQAGEHLRAALDLEPDRAASLRCLGTVYTRQGRHALAAENFLKAAELDPADTDALANAGMSLALLGRYEPALDALMRAVRQGSPTPRLYNNLGLVLYKLGRSQQALTAFTAAGGEAAAHNNLGWFLFQDGRYAEAVEHFSRAMDLSPSFYARAADNLKRARLAAGLQASAPAASPAPGVIRPPAVVKAAHVSVADASVRDSGDALADDPPVSRGAKPWRSRSVEETGPVYTVHVSSWHTRKHARLNAARLEGRMNVNAYVFKVDLGDKGQWWRVTAGSYRSLADARAAMARLEHDGLKDLRIIRRRPSRETAPAPTPETGI